MALTRPKHANTQDITRVKGTRAGKRDVAPWIRANGLKAVAMAAKRAGRSVEEEFANLYEEDRLGFLNMLAKFTVREKQVSGKVEHDHKHTHESLSDTAGWLEELLGGAAEGEIAEPVQARPVLPAAVRIEEAGH